MALAFDCDTPAQVDRAWRELTASGYTGHLEPWDAVWGMRYAVVMDPDGRPVDLFAALPAATEPTESDTGGFDVHEFNAAIIAEFRANSGVVGGQFEGSDVVLLTNTGAKSGKQRVNPLVCQPADDGTIYVFASKGGAPSNPDWYYNVIANPAVTVEFGTETFDAVATVVTGSERDAIYARQAERYEGFAEYARLTDRVIPVIALRRV